MEPVFPPGCRDRFECLGLLATGGFGAVFLARQRDLGREVVIKALAAGALGAPDQASRFANEARVTAAISHPNVVRVFDHGIDAGVPWICYEYVEGRTLREALGAGPLPVADALGVAVEIASALRSAHEMGILHRDVKPENVLEGADSRWKLADFGIAKWRSDASVQTASGVIVGTPAYMAPESIRGEPPGPPADLYSLGVVLFEMLTASLPLSGDTPLELVQAHLTKTPARLRAVRADVPAALDRIVAQLLEKDPALRYPSADALVADLETIATRRPAAVTRVVDRRPEPAVRTRAKEAGRTAGRPGRELPARAILAFTAVLGVAVGIGLAVHLRPRVDRVTPSPTVATTGSPRTTAPSPLAASVTRPPSRSGDLKQLVDSLERANGAMSALLATRRAPTLLPADEGDEAIVGKMTAEAVRETRKCLDEVVDRLESIAPDCVRTPAERDRWLRVPVELWKLLDRVARNADRVHGELDPRFVGPIVERVRAACHRLGRSWHGPVLDETIDYLADQISRALHEKTAPTANPRDMVTSTVSHWTTALVDLQGESGCPEKPTDQETVTTAWLLSEAARAMKRISRKEWQVDALLDEPVRSRAWLIRRALDLAPCLLATSDPRPRPRIYVGARLTTMVEQILSIEAPGLSAEKERAVRLLERLERLRVAYGVERLPSPDAHEWSAASRKADQLLKAIRGGPTSGPGSVAPSPR